MLFDIMEQHFKRNIGPLRSHVKSFSAVKSAGGRPWDGRRAAVGQPEGRLWDSWKGGCGTAGRAVVTPEECDTA